jgi:hypothetical protein
MHWQRVSEIFEALSSGVNSLWTASQTWMLFVPRRKYSWAAQRSIPAAEGNGCVTKSSRFSRSENASEIFGKKTTHAGKCSRRNIDYLGLALLRRINEPADAEYFPSDIYQGWSFSITLTRRSAAGMSTAVISDVVVRGTTKPQGMKKNGV